LRALIFILGLFLTPRAFGFACEYYGDHNEIELKGEIQDLHIGRTCPDGLERILQKPTVFFLTSIGGNIERIVRLAVEFRRVAVMAYEHSGVLPTVIVKEHCSSACLPVLASLNRLSEEGLIHLIVAHNTLLGFHGASKQFAGSTSKNYTREGTIRYLGYFQRMGGRANWIRQHKAYFRSAKLTELYPDVNWANLHGANLIDHARVMNLNELYGRDLGKKNPGGPLHLDLVTQLFAK
jgi:hypothetical protein